MGLVVGKVYYIESQRFELSHCQNVMYCSCMMYQPIDLEVVSTFLDIGKFSIPPTEINISRIGVLSKSIIQSIIGKVTLIIYNISEHHIISICHMIVWACHIVLFSYTKLLI